MGPENHAADLARITSGQEGPQQMNFWLLGRADEIGCIMNEAGVTHGGGSAPDIGGSAPHAAVGSGMGMDSGVNQVGY